MDDKMIDNGQIEIDLQRLLRAMLNKAWLIAAVSVLCAVIAFAGTFFFVTPTYQSSAMFYVNNKDISIGSVSVGLSASDISASRGLVDTYIVILKTRETMLDVIDYAGVDVTYEQVKGMIQAEAVDETEVFRVTVTNPDPNEAERIANAIAYILPKRISTIIDSSSAKVVDSAVVPTRPSSPSYTRNTMLGFVIGLMLVAAYITVREILDVTIRVEEDIIRGCKHPVLADVPDMAAQTRSGQSWGKKSAYDKSGAADGKQIELIGSGISFAAAESYKLLRTKLLFSFADEKNCRIIGVSSALTGEGKSLTALNLAYATSELGKRVLLIDCDLRRPSLADKLPVTKTPGLSDFLAGQCSAEHLLQFCGIKGDEQAFHVISSGRIPPNPMELLSSAKMEKMLNRLRENYDYIILDLPPVGEVGDALAAAKFTDGMLLVVRQNYCNRVALGDTVRQFEFVGAKILGVVFNCTTEDAAGYASSYYKKYYSKYHKGYYSHYGKAAAAAKKAKP